MDYQAAKAFIVNKLNEELSEKLSYHGVHHTLDVLNICEELCELEGVSTYESLLIKTAALFHDCGFTQGINDHEITGCNIARKNLPSFVYSEEEIERICGMIMATKIPQSPKNILEQIICDADLDYLGRDDFYRIGDTLFVELKAYNILESRDAWDRIQVKFLGNHSYFTATNQNRRESKKQFYLEELKKKVGEE